MTPRLLLVSAVLAAGCASGRAGTAAAPAPASPARPPATPATPAPPVGASAPARVRYGPGALRYLVHRQLNIQQTLGDQVQSQSLGARIFVTMAISGPADSVG